MPESTPKSVTRWRVRGSSVVGEFTLIVLGVLAALAADSAIDRHRERVAAREALESLRADLHSDLLDLDRYWAPELARQEEARRRLASFLRDGGPITDSLQFVSDVGDVTFYATLDPNTSAIQELLNSGRLRLIQDDFLRGEILAYRRAVENIAEFDLVHRAYFLDLSGSLAVHVVGGLSYSASFEDFAARSTCAERSGAPRRACPDSSTARAARAEAARALDATRIRSSGTLRELLAATGPPFVIKATRYRSLREDGARLILALDAALAR